MQKGVQSLTRNDNAGQLSSYSLTDAVALAASSASWSFILRVQRCTHTQIDVNCCHQVLAMRLPQITEYIRQNFGKHPPAQTAAHKMVSHEPSTGSTDPRDTAQLTDSNFANGN